MDAKVEAGNNIRALAGKAARVVVAAAFAILALVQLASYAANHSRVAEVRASFAQVTVVQSAG